MFLEMKFESFPRHKPFCTVITDVDSAFMFPDVVRVATFITESSQAILAAEPVVSSVLLGVSQETLFLPECDTTKIANKSVLSRVQFTFVLYPRLILCLTFVTAPPPSHSIHNSLKEQHNNLFINE